MTETERWIERRLEGAPEPVLAAMRQAVAGQAGSPGVVLVRSALVEYRRVLGGSGRREDATPLLIADALLTHAFQAEADTGPAADQKVEQVWYEGLAELMQRLDG